MIQSVVPKVIDNFTCNKSLIKLLIGSATGTLFKEYRLLFISPSPLFEFVVGHVGKWEKARGLGESWAPGRRLCLWELLRHRAASGLQIPLFFSECFLEEIENIFRGEATWGEVWENEKCRGNTSRQVSILFQQLSPVYESFYNSKETQKIFAICFWKHRVKIKEWTLYFQYQNATSLGSSLHCIHSKKCQVS